MTEEKEAKIRDLSAAYMKKRLVFDAMGAVNTYGKSVEERISMAQDAHVAEAEMFEAHAALKAAQEP